MCSRKITINLLAQKVLIKKVKLTVPASDAREADDDDEMWFPSRS